MCTTYPVYNQVYCADCGQLFAPTTLGEALCWQCRNNNGIDFIGDWSHVTTAITQIYTSKWDQWNILNDMINNFMYKLEDEWFVWKIAKDKEKWEEGVIYQSKNFFDFMEHVIDFTGSRGWTTMTSDGSDIELK